VTALRARLRGGDRLVGTVLSLHCAPLAELAAAPFDLVWIDLEHGALGLAGMQDVAIGAQAAGTAAAVRLPRWDWDRLPAVLDAGVDGVVVPAVESADQAAAFCARLRHPPAGARGLGPRRAGRYGRVARFWDSLEAEPACLIQIETPAGVGVAAEIARVPGVDALVLGCSDLSLALGRPQELDAPPVRHAAATVRAAARAEGVAFGVAGAGPPAALAELAGPGTGLLVYSCDTRLYAQAVDETAAGLRAALGAADRERQRVRA
jgi:2-keto-3-deoxy-L-rhamnonate aldolase RhmA